MQDVTSGFKDGFVSISSPSGPSKFLPSTKAAQQLLGILVSGFEMTHKIQRLEILDDFEVTNDHPRKFLSHSKRRQRSVAPFERPSPDCACVESNCPSNDASCWQRPCPKRPKEDVLWDLVQIWHAYSQDHSRGMWPGPTNTRSDVGVR
jgi:hypothetical protein